MRKIVRKLIPVWKVHEEEAWLNSMADAGWKLCHVSFCKYEFESCEKGAYRIRVELLEKNFDQPETADYLAFMEETGPKSPPVGCAGHTLQGLRSWASLNCIPTGRRGLST